MINIEDGVVEVELDVEVEQVIEIELDIDELNITLTADEVNLLRGQRGSDANVTSENIQLALGYVPTRVTKTSDIQNDSDYATNDSVNQKIAAIPTPDVSGQISTHNTSSSAHQDIRNLIPTDNLQLTNGAGYLTQHQSLSNYYTQSQVNELVNGKTQSFTIASLAALGSLFDLTITAVANEFSISNTSITYGNKQYTLKNGDVFYIVATDVPDYWVSVDDMKLYKMETTKVDLTGYVTRSELDAEQEEAQEDFEDELDWYAANIGNAVFVDVKPDWSGSYTFTPTNADGEELIKTGQTITITATPAEGYRFLYWELDNYSYKRDGSIDDYEDLSAVISNGRITANPITFVANNTRHSLGFKARFEAIEETSE